MMVLKSWIEAPYCWASALCSSGDIELNRAMSAGETDDCASTEPTTDKEMMSNICDFRTMFRSTHELTMEGLKFTLIQTEEEDD